LGHILFGTAAMQLTEKIDKPICRFYNKQNAKRLGTEYPEICYGYRKEYIKR